MWGKYGPPRSRSSARRTPHIADILIAERGEKIVNSRLWPLLRPLLYKILHYDEAVRMADELAPLPADAAMAYVSRLALHRPRRRRAWSGSRKDGAFIVAANHPTGIADGVAVYDASTRVRAGYRHLHQPRRPAHQSAALRVPDPGRVARGLPRPRQDARDAAALLARLPRRPRRGALPLRPHRLLEGRPAQRAAVAELGHHAGAQAGRADHARSTCSRATPGSSTGSPTGTRSCAT